MNFLLISLSFLLHSPVVVQDTITPLKDKIYVIHIKGSPASISGYLGAIEDNAISINSGSVHYGDVSNGKLVPYNIIDRVSIHRKGSAVKGVLFGALAGIIVGGIVGAIAHSSLPNNSSPSGGFNFNFDLGLAGDIAAVGALGSIPGALIGAIIGSKVHHYDINRSKEGFESIRSQLMNVYGVK